MIPGHWTDQYGLGGIVTRESHEQAISELRAQNAELVAALEEARRQRDEAQREEAALRAQNAELVAALKPFVSDGPISQFEYVLAKEAALAALAAAGQP